MCSFNINPILKSMPTAWRMASVSDLSDRQLSLRLPRYCLDNGRTLSDFACTSSMITVHKSLTLRSAYAEDGRCTRIKYRSSACLLLHPFPRTCEILSKRLPDITKTLTLVAPTYSLASSFEATGIIELTSVSARGVFNTYMSLISCVPVTCQQHPLRKMPKESLGSFTLTSKSDTLLYGNSF